jgi:hypothetical protein
VASRKGKTTVEPVLSFGQHQMLKMIKCRAYGHRWNDHGYLPIIWAGIRLWEQLFDCDRCTMTRKDRYTQASMNQHSRAYGKPSSYPGRLPSKEAKRILTGQTEAQCWALAEQSPFVVAA